MSEWGRISWLNVRAYLTTFVIRYVHKSFFIMTKRPFLNIIHNFLLIQLKCKHEKKHSIWLNRNSNSFQIPFSVWRYSAGSSMNSMNYVDRKYRMRYDFRAVNFRNEGNKLLSRNSMKNYAIRFCNTTTRYENVTVARSGLTKLMSLYWWKERKKNIVTFCIVNIYL